MYDIGDGKYALAFVMPFAGTYDFGVSTWGTLSACVCRTHRFPYSGAGGKSPLVIEQDNTVVRVVFDAKTLDITVETRV